MDALVMCGGRGTRLDADGEKPLYEVGGRPMVDRVLDALADGGVETVHAVGSPATPRTLEYVGVPTIEATGDGYVADLGYALDRVSSPVLTVAADLPLLDGAAVERVTDAAAGGSLAVYVPTEFVRGLGATADATTELDGRTVTPAGINVVGPRDGEAEAGSDGDGDEMEDCDGGGDHDRATREEAALVCRDVRYAVNVNRVRDARVAEALL